MFFPVSGVEIQPLIPFLVALSVSFFTSMGGVSGAFILLPFQVSILNYTAPSVSATNQVFNIIAIPSGIYRYISEGRMLWPLAVSIVIGSLPGVFIGAWIRIEYLPDPRNFKFFAGFVLLYIGWRLIRDIIGKKEKSASLPVVTPDQLTKKIQVVQSSAGVVRFEFSGAVFTFIPLQIICICFLVGIAGGIYGIGGGAIISPFLITIFGLPVYTVAGAALMGTFVTSIAGVFFYHVLSLFYSGINVSPDWLLGALFGFGGLIGMYLGARTQRHVSSRGIKTVLCFSTLFIAANYLIGFWM